MANVNYLELQSQYDKIYSYFKNTCEHFDFLEWDGNILEVWDHENIIEIYSYKDLKKIIF